MSEVPLYTREVEAPHGSPTPSAVSLGLIDFYEVDILGLQGVGAFS